MRRPTNFSKELDYATFRPEIILKLPAAGFWGTSVRMCRALLFNITEECVYRTTVVLQKYFISILTISFAVIVSRKKKNEVVKVVQE
jgi:hypothetical protein